MMIKLIFNFVILIKFFLNKNKILMIENYILSKHHHPRSNQWYLLMSLFHGVRSIGSPTK